MEDHPNPGDWMSIVGIVSDVKQLSLADSPSASVYQPYLQLTRPFFLNHMNFVVQTSENPKAMASGIRAVIHNIDRELPTQSIATMEDIISDITNAARSQMRLLGMFSIMAVLLAAVGI